MESRLTRRDRDRDRFLRTFNLRRLSARELFLSRLRRASKRRVSLHSKNDVRKVQNSINSSRRRFAYHSRAQAAS